MIVGPMTDAIWPICGPLKFRMAPHDWDEVLPLLPPTDGRFVPTHPAWPIWLPPTALAPRPPRPLKPVGSEYTGSVETVGSVAAAGIVYALAPTTGPASASAPAAAARDRVRVSRVFAF